MQDNNSTQPQNTNTDTRLTLKSRTKKTTLLCVILGILLLGAVGFIVYDKFIATDKDDDSSKTENNQPVKLEKGTFRLDPTDGMGWNGYTQVEGYATIKTMPDCWETCENDNPDTVEYVMFHVVRSGNQEFLKYIGNNEGNAFGGGGVIGLGCTKDGSIYYVNHSDASFYALSNDNGDLNPTAVRKLSASDSVKILASTKDNPIILNLERERLSSGSGAPACYSHITTISLPY